MTELVAPFVPIHGSWTFLPDMNCLLNPSGRSIRLSVRLQEYAETYAANIERYKAYKHLSNDEVLELLPVLLRDAASDFYESLNADQKTNWTVSRTPSYNVLAILQPNAGRTPTFYGLIHRVISMSTTI